MKYEESYNKLHIYWKNNLSHCKRWAARKTRNTNVKVYNWM